MDQLKNIYKNIAQKEENFSHAFKIGQISSIWQRVIDKKIKMHAEPYKILGTDLYILAANPVWAQQLTFLKNEILEKINSLLEDDKIENIIFRNGNINEEKLSSKKSRDIRDEKQKTTEEIIELGQRENYCKEKGWAKCDTCGAYHHGENETCFFCQKSKDDKRFKARYRLMRNVPWINYKSAKEEIDDLTKEEYDKTKREISSKLKDEINLMVYKNRLRQEPIKKNIYKQMIYEYTMHKSGLHPKEINEKIIKKYFRDEIMKLLLMKGEKPKNGKE